MHSPYFYHHCHNRRYQVRDLAKDSTAKVRLVTNGPVSNLVNAPGTQQIKMQGTRPVFEVTVKRKTLF
jgi:hypothetical protein